MDAFELGEIVQAGFSVATNHSHHGPGPLYVSFWNDLIRSQTRRGQETVGYM